VVLWQTGPPEVTKSSTCEPCAALRLLEFEAPALLVMPA
jgi:hypothetical protein